jgi:hypothetical protein
MGAADPTSGTVSLFEIVRGFGHLLRNGWKPLRTIVFASWDAEEVISRFAPLDDFLLTGFLCAVRLDRLDRMGRGKCTSSDFLRAREHFAKCAQQDFSDWIGANVVAYLQVGEQAVPTARHPSGAYPLQMFPSAARAGCRLRRRRSHTLFAPPPRMSHIPRINTGLSGMRERTWVRTRAQLPMRSLWLLLRLRSSCERKRSMNLSASSALLVAAPTLRSSCRELGCVHRGVIYFVTRAHRSLCRLRRLTNRTLLLHTTPCITTTPSTIHNTGKNISQMKVSTDT